MNCCTSRRANPAAFPLSHGPMKFEELDRKLRYFETVNDLYALAICRAADRCQTRRWATRLFCRVPIPASTFSPTRPADREPDTRRLVPTGSLVPCASTPARAGWPAHRDAAYAQRLLEVLAGEESEELMEMWRFAKLAAQGGAGRR